MKSKFHDAIEATFDVLRKANIAASVGQLFKDQGIAVTVYGRAEAGKLAQPKTEADQEALMKEVADLLKGPTAPDLLQGVDVRSEFESHMPRLH